MSTVCNLCGGSDIKVLETAADGVRAVRCARCRLIFLDPFPKFDRAGHYDAEYYRPWRVEQAQQRAVLWGRRVALLERFARVGRLLDVGCGDGSFLLAARDRGWQVTGTEVSRWVVRMLRERHGFAIAEGDLLELDQPDTSFDVVTMWHVLEHVDRPLQTLTRARELLGRDGILIVAVPKAGFTLMRLAYPLARGKRLRYYTPGERELHLYHFTPDTLRALLERAGFRLLFEGIDENALQPVSLLLEKTAKALHRLAGACWSEAMLIVATTEGT